MAERQAARPVRVALKVAARVGDGEWNSLLDGEHTASSEPEMYREITTALRDLADAVEEEGVEAALRRRLSREHAQRVFTQLSEMRSDG